MSFASSETAGAWKKRFAMIRAEEAREHHERVLEERVVVAIPARARRRGEEGRGREERFVRREDCDERRDSTTPMTPGSRRDRRRELWMTRRRRDVTAGDDGARGGAGDEGGARAPAAREADPEREDDGREDVRHRRVPAVRVLEVFVV